MPELPEVETTRRGVELYLKGRRVKAVVVRQRKLRRCVTRGIHQSMTGQVFECIERRGKYLLGRTDGGTLIIHLGMSGSLRILDQSVKPLVHDHLDVVLDDNHLLRFRDPRRFGMVLWTCEDPLQHPLLRHLGPEPLAAGFDGEYLYQQARGRSGIAVKNFIMDSRVVVGVGNIYANESLYAAGIHPLRAARRVSEKRFGVLAIAIRKILFRAIEKGGTTLRDFVREDGNPGYFKASLKVYSRTGKPCIRCGKLISCCRVGQRSSFYCTRCQH